MTTTFSSWLTTCGSQKVSLSWTNLELQCQGDKGGLHQLEDVPRFAHVTSSS